MTVALGVTVRAVPALVTTLPYQTAPALKGMIKYMLEGADAVTKVDADGISSSMLPEAFDVASVVLCLCLLFT